MNGDFYVVGSEPDREVRFAVDGIISWEAVQLPPLDDLVAVDGWVAEVILRHLNIPRGNSVGVYFHAPMRRSTQ